MPIIKYNLKKVIFYFLKLNAPLEEAFIGIYAFYPIKNRLSIWKLENS